MEQKRSLYQVIKQKCLTSPLHIDVSSPPFRDDELEIKLIKKNGKTACEMNVYDTETYRSVHTGKYYKQDLLDSMLAVFTEETKDLDETIYLYMYYDPDEKTFVHHRF
jgi:hypothetical protein